MFRDNVASAIETVPSLPDEDRVALETSVWSRFSDAALDETTRAWWASRREESRSVLRRLAEEGIDSDATKEGYEAIRLIHFSTMLDLAADLVSDPRLVQELSPEFLRATRAYVARSLIFVLDDQPPTPARSPPAN